MRSGWIVATMAMALAACEPPDPLAEARRACLNERTEAEARVEACSAVLESGELSAADRAAAYSNRGDATYEAGDGIPPGEYAVTFKWQPFNLMTRDYGPDKFKGRYAKAESSEIKVSVSEGDPPKDKGTIDLTTKK